MSMKEMRRVKVVAVAANFNAGRLELTKEQYEPRKHNLKQTETALVFEIVNSVQFKQGEEVGFDGVINKVLADYLDADPDETETGASASAGHDRIGEIAVAIASFPEGANATVKTADGKKVNCWNQDGKTPNVKAIEAVLGYDIGAAERDEAVYHMAEGESGEE